MKTWLKGGVVGIIVGLLNYILFAIFYPPSYIYHIEGIKTLIDYFFIIPLSYFLIAPFLMVGLGLCNWEDYKGIFGKCEIPNIPMFIFIYITALLFILLIFFILGSIIGLIINKIKGKNK